MECKCPECGHEFEEVQDIEIEPQDYSWRDWNVQRSLNSTYGENK